MPNSNIIPLPQATVRVQPLHTNVTCQARVSRGESPHVFKNGDVQLAIVIPDPQDPAKTRRCRCRFAAAEGWTPSLVSAFLPRGATFDAKVDVYPPIIETNDAGEVKIDPRTGEPYYRQTIVLLDATNIVKPAINLLVAKAQALAPKQQAKPVASNQAL